MIERRYAGIKYSTLTGLPLIRYTNEFKIHSEALQRFDGVFIGPDIPDWVLRERQKFIHIICPYCKGKQYNFDRPAMICCDCGKAIFIEHCTNDDIAKVSSHTSPYDIGEGNLCRQTRIPLSYEDDNWLEQQLRVK